MIECAFRDVTIQCLRGDIVEQADIDAIVNAANAELRSGGGVAGAIHRAAGPRLQEACSPLAPIRPGEAVITPGFDLPNRSVIHCLGPVYGQDDPAPELLASCYRHALVFAEQHEHESIAFPAISTGVFGYPPEAAAVIALKTVVDGIPRLNSVNRIRFVLFGDVDLEIYKETLLAFRGPCARGKRVVF